MTLTFIGKREDLRYYFLFLWEEAGLYFHVTSTSYGDSAQEYDIIFPAKDYDASNLTIRIGGGFDYIVKEKIVLWVNKPGVRYRQLIEEIKKECIQFLEQELTYDNTLQSLIYRVFEDPVLRVKHD